MGAAAFALGLALAGPQSAAVAVADSTDSSHSTDRTNSTDGTDRTDSASTTETSPQQTARAPRPASARGAARDTEPDLSPALQPDRGARRDHAAADIDPDSPPADSALPALPARSVGVVVPEASTAPQAPAPEPPSTLAAQPDRVVAVAAPAAPQPARDPSPPPVSVLRTLTTAAEPPAARAVSAPRGLTAVTTPVGAAAASSVTDLVNGLLAPIQSLFEGAALLVRRSLFNEAPSVSPVQLTGLTQGPITGSLGAVDPEGDPLSYQVTSAPRYGTVTIGQDGSYSYTPATGFTGADNFVVTATDTGVHVNLLNLARPTGTAADVAVAQSALTAAALRFQFLYGTGSQYWTPEARAALEAAAAKLGSYVVVSSPVVITYTVTTRNSPLSSTLATSGSDFVAPQAGFMNTVVQNKIQNGVDANGSAADGTIDWNMGKPWGYGNTVGSTQYDFRSTAMHELLHTFGFLTYVDAPNSNTGRIWTVYDGYLVNSAGTEVISTTYSWNTAYNTNLTGGNGGLYFGGPNAVAANNGLVSLYTPGTWTSGSSLSHLNDAVFSGSRRRLMDAVSTTGPNVRTLSPVELGILQDIGYRVSNGSGTSALMVFGVFLTRRMRREN